MNLINDCLSRITDFFQSSYMGRENISSSDVVLYIAADEINQQNSAIKRIFGNIQIEEESKLKLIFKVVKNIEEINQISKKLKDQNNRICGLFLYAHGSPYRINLSKTKYTPENSSHILKKNVKMLEPTFSRLEEQSSIVLLSCSTGKVKEGKTPIAETISSIAKKTVFAPTDIAHDHATTLTLDKKTISANFIGKFINPNPNSFFSWLTDFYNLFLFVYGAIGRDITARFDMEKA